MRLSMSKGLINGLVRALPQPSASRRETCSQTSSAATTCSSAPARSSAGTHLTTLSASPAGDGSPRRCFSSDFLRGLRGLLGVFEVAEESRGE
mmetsp:Transcript_42931/g.135481  ORF Transcript_42931/g.135481 Transcript_42931/m.135481 type:complete len:93 (+) Transcript_42931:1923-2201(+)